MDCDSAAQIERATDEAIRAGADCLVCADDYIAQSVLAKLSRDGIEVPKDLKIASFYNSALLEHNRPPITAIKYDPRQLGFEAARTLIAMIGGEEVQPKKLLGYEVVLKGSTL
jgi:DNA-binding LacI/PurR family transcriptional regulator